MIWLDIVISKYPNNNENEGCYIKTFSKFLDTCDGDYLMLRNGDDLATSPLILIHPGNYCYDF